MVDANTQAPRYRLSTNRLSLLVILLTGLAWLVLFAIGMRAEPIMTGEGEGTMVGAAMEFLAARWKLSDLPPEAMWRAVAEVAQTCVVAVGLGWFVVLRDDIVRGVMGRAAYCRMAAPRALQVFCAVLLTLVICAHLGTGLFRDYAAHATQWSAVLDGLDPWRSPEAVRNTYGPLFTLFALAFAANPLWPAALFAYLWFGCWLFIVGRLLDDRTASVEGALIASLLFVMGPYFWVLLGFYAHFDIVPAASALIAVHLTLIQRPFGAGVVLALGVLAKFYPIFILPFLMLHRCAIDWRPALACGLVVVAGAGIAYALWGESVFDPLAFAAERRTRHLSILRFAEGRIVEAVIGSPISVQAMGVPLAAVGGLALFVYCAWKEVDVAIGAALAPIVVLLFYPLAHFQFFAICFLLVAYWYAVDRGRFDGSASLRWAMVLYLGWVSLFAVLFYLSHGHMRVDPAQWIRDFAGLPAFCFGAYFVWAALSAAAADSRPNQAA